MQFRRILVLLLSVKRCLNYWTEYECKFANQLIESLQPSSLFMLVTVSDSESIVAIGTRDGETTFAIGAGKAGRQGCS